MLVVAPHGGQRDPRTAPAPAGLKVNDLHTADLAADMAMALDAAYVINPCWDRNDLDLNRVSQVAVRAPWFLRLLEELVGDLLRRHERAEVLFIHGWNITQPKCDIGIGSRLRAAGDGAARAGELTVSPDYLADRLIALQDACAARGIAVGFGERYPGRHPNNVLQLFRRAPRAHCAAPQLAAWAAAGRIEAVQLELGVPLRWPGPLRGAFVAAVAECFRAPHRPHTGAGRSPTVVPPRSEELAARPPATVDASRDGAPPAAYALQCYDPAADLAIVLRVEPAPTGAGVSARVLLFTERRRVGLFTGEESGAVAMGGGGPHIAAAGDGFRVRFDGALLATDDGDRYVDLESAFAASELAMVGIDLRFHPGAVPGLGCVRGLISVDGMAHRIDAPGFARPVLLQHGPGGWRSQLTLNAIFAADLAVRVRHVVPGAPASLRELSAREDSARPLQAVTVQFDRDRHTPTHFALRGTSDELIAAPLTRVTIIRTSGPHHRARVTFGAARFQRGGREGFGFYEYARVL